MNEKEIDALATSYFKICHPSILELMKEEIKSTDKLAREVIGKSIEECNYQDEIDIVKKLKTPMAILHGEDEQFVNFDYMKNLDILSLWRNKVQIIPDSGHAPHLEQSEIFNKYLEEFIEDVL